jgi:hypothetical protein
LIHRHISTSSQVRALPQDQTHFSSQKRMKRNHDKVR